MQRLKINKQRKREIRKPLNDQENFKPSKFQIDIPGVGRLRTGEKHLDFHQIEAKEQAIENIEQEISKPEEVVKSY